MSEEKVARVIPPKAYKNANFLDSREARTIRIICEFEETLQRLREQGVKETIMFFGSARAKTKSQHEQAVKEAQGMLAQAKTQAEIKSIEDTLERLEAGKWMCDIVETVEDLACRLTEWSMNYQSADVVGGGYLSQEKDKVKNVQERNVVQSLMVCTGGGPGLMEAANRGASRVKGAKNIGMGITLPFEKGLNPYVSEELAFEYHYFFTRKYWMMFPCRALVVTPGGFGTMDELFELLVLKQTSKIKIDVPIVLIGKEYWTTVLNLQAAVDMGTLSQKAVDSLFYTDDVEEAFNYITKCVLALR